MNKKRERKQSERGMSFVIISEPKLIRKNLQLFAKMYFPSTRNVYSSLFFGYHSQSLSICSVITESKHSLCL